MKHPETRCDCAEAVNPLALRWRCPVCGESRTMRVSTLAAVCDSESIRKGEPQGNATKREQLWSKAGLVARSARGVKLTETTVRLAKR
jgi:hypothetical protein